MLTFLTDENNLVLLKTKNSHGKERAICSRFNIQLIPITYTLKVKSDVERPICSCFFYEFQYVGIVCSIHAYRTFFIINFYIFTFFWVNIQKLRA